MLYSLVDNFYCRPLLPRNSCLFCLEKSARLYDSHHYHTPLNRYLRPGFRWESEVAWTFPDVLPSWLKLSLNFWARSLHINFYYLPNFRKDHCQNTAACLHLLLHLSHWYQCLNSFDDSKRRFISHAILWSSFKPHHQKCWHCLSHHRLIIHCSIIDSIIDS